MTAPAEPAAVVADLMADVMHCQAQVSRAEATLTNARGRLTTALGRLARAAQGRGEPLPPLAAAVVECGDLAPTDEQPPEEPSPGTLRERIAAVIDAAPGEVFTPATVGRALESPNRDSIRNTLLVLAAKGRVEKLGPGQYQARKPDGAP